MSCEHTEGRFHDCAYVEKRNRAVTIACIHADKLLGQQPMGPRLYDEWSQRWNRAFHQAMRNLMEESSDASETGQRSAVEAHARA